MGKPEFEVDDAVILLMGGPSSVPSLQGRIEGITRLEKLVFLLERETDLGGLLTERSDFKPHNFGPFSALVYQAVDTLGAAGLIEDSARLAGSAEDSWEATNIVGSEGPYATRDFQLTGVGRRYYDALLRELPRKVESTIESFKESYGALPLRQLIRYVYTSYPEYTEKSLIREEVLGE